MIHIFPLNDTQRALPLKTHTLCNNTPCWSRDWLVDRAKCAHSLSVRSQITSRSVKVSVSGKILGWSRSHLGLKARSLVSVFKVSFTLHLCVPVTSTSGNIYLQCRQSALGCQQLRTNYIKYNYTFLKPAVLDLLYSAITGAQFTILLMINY